MMMSEEQIVTPGETHEVRVIHVPQRRLDLRRVIAGVVGIVLLIVMIHYGYIDPRSLRVIVGAFLGAIIGFSIGYIRAPRPDYYIEIDVTKAYNVLDVRLVPRHLRPPRTPAIPTASTGGSTIYLITNEELAELGLSELNVRRDELRALVKRVVRLQKTITERLMDVDIEANRKARELFERYLRLRRKLYQEAIESPREKVEEGGE